MLGEPFGVEEAAAIGLVSHPVGAGQLDRKLEATVDALLRKPAEALRQTRRLLRLGTRDEIIERMELESGLFAERLESDEVKQAISAFFAARAKA
jgi:enoyl-CoA hydratase/carnithine racemase